MLPNISRSKNNQALKFDELRKYSVRNTIFLEYFIFHPENEVGRLAADLFLFSEKALYK